MVLFRIEFDPNPNSLKDLIDDMLDLIYDINSKNDETKFQTLQLLLDLPPFMIKKNVKVIECLERVLSEFPLSFDADFPEHKKLIISARDKVMEGLLTVIFNLYNCVAKSELRTHSSASKHPCN